MKYVIGLIAGFVPGSIPFGLITARLLRGIDIRKYGSGNIGAANVARVVGKGPGLLVFLLDVLKGLLPALILRVTLGTDAGIAAGIAAIAGHIFSPLLKFKGGKGVATSLGVFIGLAPITSGVGFIVWLIFFLTLRWVSLASILGAISVPVFLFTSRRMDFSEFSPALLILAVVAALALLARHVPNMKRLLKGKEDRFTFWKKR
ncbi:MAG: glycerol-3-phosphate 1-O-acyltransferase PlsY [bacterium]